MKSSMGWLLLLVALAVPAFFFYNWWTKMQQSSPMEADGGAAQGGTFGSARSGGPPNPIRRKVMTPPPGKTGPVGVTGSSATAQSGEATAAEPGEQTIPAEMSDSAVPDHGETPSGEGPKLKAMTPPSGGRKGKMLEYNPQTNRDPTLSVLDHKILAMRAEARRRALMPPPPPPKQVIQKPKPEVSKAPPVWTQISVQGIISTPNGRAAIVNDEVRYVGDTILGTEIKRITGSTVIFSHKGRTFYKKMQ